MSEYVIKAPSVMIATKKEKDNYYSMLMDALNGKNGIIHPRHKCRWMPIYSHERFPFEIYDENSGRKWEVRKCSSCPRILFTTHANNPVTIFGFTEKIVLNDPPGTVY